MKGETHIDLSLAAAEAMGWPGDRKLLARSARYPDDVCATEVDGVGAHLFGLNLESLKHFGRMVRRGNEGFVPVGYCWATDKSIPNVNLPDRAVIAKPKEWGPPVGPVMAKNEPLATLLRDLAGNASVAADEITFPAATTMACWCEVIIQTLPRDMGPAARQMAVDTVSGWALHFVQDLCIPQHAGCYLGAGHASYEAELAEMWQQMRSAGDLPYKPGTLTTTMPFDFQTPTSMRSLVERVALESYASRSALGWRRWIWRPGWRKLMRESIYRGYAASIAALHLTAIL